MRHGGQWWSRRLFDTNDHAIIRLYGSWAYDQFCVPMRRNAHIETVFSYRRNTQTEVNGMLWLKSAGLLVLAYLLGALPVGYLAARWIKRVNITQIGSGRTGASNVLRAAGVVPAAITLLGDFGKGYAAVAVARLLVPELPVVAVLAGVCAVAGHNWSVFLGFEGGVGTMTTIGAAVALSPIAAAIALGSGVIVVLIWRHSSVGSLTFAGVLSLVVLGGAILGHWPYTRLLFALGTTAMATWELRPNIQRLKEGTERKIGQFIQPGQCDVAPEANGH